MTKKRYCKKRRSKFSSWKRLKSRFQLKRKLRIVGSAFLVVISTLATLVFLYLFKVAKQPFAEAGVGGSSFSWSGRRPVNIALLVTPSKSHQELQEGAILHLDPYKGKAILIRLSPDVLPGAGLGAASWLGNLSKGLALPICGYFLIDNQGLLKLYEIWDAGDDWTDWGLGVLPVVPRLIPIFNEHLVTNSSLGEIFRIVSFVLGLRFDQKTELNVEGVLTADAVGVSCFDEEIKDEGARILVLNGTTDGGLAAKAARWVENMGGTVLDVGNAPQQNYDKSLILASDVDSYTVRTLASSFDIPDLRNIEGVFDWAKRADVVLILGLDKSDFF